MAGGVVAACMAALRGYGLSGAVEPLESDDGSAFRVDAGSERYCLKLLGAGTAESRVRSQLELMGFLRGAGLPVARAVAAADGSSFTRLTTEDGDRLAILFEWIEGKSPDATADEGWIERSGALLGRLHERSREFRPAPGFDARRWDRVYAPRPRGWLDRFLDEGLVDDRGRRAIERASERVRTLVGPAPEERVGYGLIHADFHHDNLIAQGDRLWIVDFEEFGWGHFLFDVTWPAALFARKHGTGRDFLGPFLEGYERCRPLSVEDRSSLSGFLLAAGIAVLEMVHASSLPADGREARQWHEFAISWLSGHLARDSDR